MSMNGMGEESAASNRRQLKGVTASTALTCDEQRAQRQSTFDEVRPNTERNYN